MKSPKLFLSDLNCDQLSLDGVLKVLCIFSENREHFILPHAALLAAIADVEVLVSLSPSGKISMR
jgi:hypothetical protein